MGGAPRGGGGRLQAAVKRSADAVSASDTQTGRRLSIRTVVRAFRLARMPWAIVACTWVLIFVLGAVSLVVPKVTQWAIDSGMIGQSGEVLVKACLVLLGLQILLMVGGVGSGLLMNRIGQASMHTLRCRVFEHMQSLSLDFYERREPGKIIARVTSDIDAVNELLRLLLTGLAQDFLKAVGITAIMFIWDWRLALMVHALLPAIIGIMLTFRRYSERIFRRVRETLAGIAAYLHETVTGIRVIKAFAREGVSQRIFAELTDGHATAQLAQGRLFGTLFPTMQFVSALSLVVIFWYGGTKLASGEIQLGSLVAFLMYSQMLFEPWRALTEFAASAQRAAVALDRIFEVLDEVPSVRDREGAQTLAPLKGQIAFENVTFSYDGADDVLNDVSLVARTGDVTAIVGPTGAGKSTIVKLLCRLYEVEHGAIKLDSVDIREGTALSLRRQVGMVPQDPFLFAGTLAENIAFGNPSADAERIRRAADAAKVTEFAAHLPDGLDTPIHERGVKLSDGQRQLLSLARAIVSDAKVLILDEATSSVDLFTEASVQAALEEARTGRVTFVIAHRLATVRHADQILVIDGGRIVARGKHKELLNTCRLYRSLYLRRFEDLSDEERLATEHQAVEARAGA